MVLFLTFTLKLEVAFGVLCDRRAILVKYKLLLFFPRFEWNLPVSGSMKERGRRYVPGMFSTDVYEKL